MRKQARLGAAASIFLAHFLGLPAHAVVTVKGTSGNDLIDVSASTEPHLIYGYGGSDRISASQASDTIDGSSGNDTIFGNDGDDVIIGGTANDTLYGGNGDDRFVVAGTSLWYDEFHGGEGVDSIVGSDGDDVIGLRVQPSSVEIIDGRGGNDVIRMPGSGTRSLDLSGITLVSVELIQGGTGTDTIIGSPGDDTIAGGSGNDTLYGGPGRDTARYLAESENYQVTWGSPTVVRSLTTTEGADTLRDIELISFVDGHFDSGIFHPKFPGNLPPVAGPDSATMPEDGSVEIRVLDNDSDPDGDPISVVALGSPSSGTVSLGPEGALVYRPRADFSGVDTFTYRIADNKYGKSYGTVTVTVTPLPDAPVARADKVSAVAGRHVTISPLLNDSDPDGDPLRLESAAAPQHGTVSQRPDGALEYLSDPGYSGSDMFTYTIADGTGFTATGTIVVDVVGSQSFVELRGLLEAVPEGSWVKLNRNPFSSVWTPIKQRPCSNAYNLPSRVLTAWGSMAFDSNRGDLIFWGGGHKNYCGNEVYRFRLSTLMWERASLPSAIYDPLGDKQYAAVDGVLNAPTSSHTYDNQEFLPLADRFITFGGAKYNINAQFVLEDGKTHTGPYLWDPSRANGNAVGGTAGSHVSPSMFPDVFGGQMWDNRNTVAVRGFSPVRPDRNFVNGTSAYAQHLGKDAVYVTLHPDLSGKLFRYVVHDLADPDLDTWELVGIRSNAYTGKGVGAVDTWRNVYLRTVGPGTSPGFLAWNLNTAGPANKDVRFKASAISAEFPAAALQYCGMDFDTVRGVYALWCTGRDVWHLVPPEVFGSSGWRLERAPTAPGGFEPPYRAADSTFPGVLGKWKYARRFDVFLGVFEGDSGNVYAYKPAGWQPLD